MKGLLAALLCSSCGLVSAQTAEELLSDGKNTENVLTFGMGYGIPMYSPLRQINKSNVKRLVPIWSTNLMNEMGELGGKAVNTKIREISPAYEELYEMIGSQPFLDLIDANRQDQQVASYAT